MAAILELSGEAAPERGSLGERSVGLGLGQVRLKRREFITLVGDAIARLQTTEIQPIPSRNPICIFSR
jgi:hypothetical protein